MSTKSETEGLLYCAVGREYLKQAEFSIRSALKQNPGLNGSVYTDQECFSYNWESIIISVGRKSSEIKNSMIYKLDAILSTPYPQTIYLDSDTYILDSITDIFSLLNRFDLVFCHGHDRNMRYELLKQAGSKGTKLFSENIPYSFAPLQGGLIGYNYDKTKEFFKLVRETFLEKNYFDDQAVIRECLWESQLKFYILPPEYNFNSIDYIKNLKRLNYREAIPKIFHYTQNKDDDIEKLIARFYTKSHCQEWKTQKSNLSVKGIIKKVRRKIGNIVLSRFK